MDPIGIGIHEQEDPFVAAGRQIETVADASADRVGERLEERVAGHLSRRGLERIERLSLHRQHGLKRGIADAAHRIGRRVPLHHEELGTGAGAV